MRTLWEYELPAEGQISDFHCASPILLHNGYVFYISVSSGCPKLLHIIDMDSGAGRTELLRSVNVCLPSDYFFIEYKEQVIIKTADSVTLPRIDKLFWPLKADDGNMLIGYTNWTNAGILKYDLLNRKIVWRHKRKFQGPQLDCKIYRHNDMVFWVKNNTELISLDMDTGAEIYSLRTTPWLYTDLRFLQDDLIYGTSGADGYINCIDARSGNVRWSVFLKNGCAYYDICGESVIVGDFNKTLKQISYSDGVILQDYRTDGEVVGRIKVSEGCIYTVIWGNSKKGVRVVKVLI